MAVSTTLLCTNFVMCVVERKFACQLYSYATKGDKVLLASLISWPFQLPLVFQYANVCEGEGLGDFVVW